MERPNPTPLSNAITSRKAHLGVGITAISREIGAPTGTIWHWAHGTAQPGIGYFEPVRQWLGIDEITMYRLIIASEPVVAQYRAVLFARRKARANRQAQ